jgi:transposase
MADILAIGAAVYCPRPEAGLSNIAVLKRVEPRRIWSGEEKAALLAEIDAEGGKVRLVARRHRISESLLYNWRSAAKAEAAGLASPAFIPLGVVVGEANRAKPVPRRPSGGGAIEIALPDGARINVGAGVNEAALARVLRAMKAVI